MIECLRYKTMNKGALQGFADLYDPLMGLEIFGCSVFMTQGRRWLNLPQKEYKDPEGNTKYAAIIRFKQPERMAAFTEQAMQAIDRLASSQPKQPQQQYGQPNYEDCPF